MRRTPERFVRDLTFGDYVSFSGEPVKLRREGFDILWCTLAPRVLTGVGIAANAPRRLGSPTTRRLPSPQQPCTLKITTTGGAPAVRSANAHPASHENL
jgi:hypothetical protein